MLTKLRALPCVLAPLFLLVVSTIAEATAVVIVKRKDEIVIGADSKQSQIGGSESRSHCKIISTGGLYFTAAGVTQDSQDYNAWSIARQSASGPGTFMDRVNAFEFAVQAPLQKTLELFAAQDPAHFSELLANTEGEILQTVFVTIERGMPTISARAFVATAIGKSVYVSVSARRMDCTECEITLFLGRHEAIDAYSFNNFIKPKGIVNGVRELIEIEIKDKPKDVGPPIDILRLTAKGAEWIQRKAECAEKK